MLTAIEFYVQCWLLQVHFFLPDSQQGWDKL
jgi:hypothetical protein